MSSSSWIRNRSKPGDVVLDVKDVHAENDKGLPALRGLSLNVRAGEIVGLAGVAGNGQIELVPGDCWACASASRAKCCLNGDQGQQPRYHCMAFDHGMAYVPEDRTHVGSSPNLSVTDNVIMKKYRKPPISKGTSWT